MSPEIAVLFRPADYQEAKGVFLDQLGPNNPTIDSPSGVLRDGVDPAIWIDLAKSALPAVAALLAVWLGKGKEVRIETQTKGKKKISAWIKALTRRIRESS